VETQLRTPSSLLHWMRRLIATRKKSRVFGRGGLRFLRPNNTRVLAHLREYQEEAILVVHNLANSAEPVLLDLQEFRGAVPVEILGDARFPIIGDGPYFLSLGPYGFYWFRLDKPETRRETYGIEDAAI
jgi:maltose alpha-D-glucosyltransferase / alpha-amylase